MKSYLQALKELREDKDMKQSDIANLLGISQQQYSKYEAGDSEIQIPMLLKLADFHKLSLDELFNRSNNQTIPIESITGLNKKVRGEYTVDMLVSDVLSLNAAGRDAVIEYIRLQKMKKDYAKNKAADDES